MVLLAIKKQLNDKMYVDRIQVRLIFDDYFTIRYIHITKLRINHV